MNLALDSVSRANALRICFRSPFYIPLVQLSIPSNPVRSPLNLIRSPLDHYIIHLPSRVNHQTTFIVQWSSDQIPGSARVESGAQPNLAPGKGIHFPEGFLSVDWKIMDNLQKTWGNRGSFFPWYMGVLPCHPIQFILGEWVRMCFRVGEQWTLGYQQFFLDGIV